MGDLIDLTEGLNTTGHANKTQDCILHQYRVWPSSCSETMIFHFRWISLVLGLAFTAALALHFKNLVCRLIQSKFIVNSKDTNLGINILCAIACMCGMMRMSNYYGYHHNDYCINSVSDTLCTSLITSIA